MLRTAFVFLFLLLLQGLSAIFYRRRTSWVGGRPSRPWEHVRLVAFLNHTSLFEPIFSRCVSPAFFWRLARHGLVPAAQKTTSRPIVGWVFKLIARNVVPISRQRDHTWREVLDSIDPDSMVVLAPEGRMKRAHGLDLQGRPMTVRGGIADILEAIPEGKFLIAYSGGLHHVQVPGQRMPRLFCKIGMIFELVDVSEYRQERRDEAAERAISFKEAVIRDLERRRDAYCPRAAALAGVPYLEPTPEALASARSAAQVANTQPAG